MKLKINLYLCRNRRKKILDAGNPYPLRHSEHHNHPSKTLVMSKVDVVHDVVVIEIN